MTSKYCNDFFPKLFTKFDVFKHAPHLTLHNKRTLSTRLGGLLTIALFILVILQVTPLLVRLFEHSNPHLYMTNELETNPANVHLSGDQNFFLAVLISINDVNVNLSQASPFNFETTFNKNTRLNNGSRIKVKYPVVWAPCDSSNIDPNIFGPNAFETYSLSLAYCAKGVNYTDSNGVCPTKYVDIYPDCILPPSFNINGQYLSEQFDFIQSNIVVCNSSDSTNFPSSMVCNTSDIVQAFQTSDFKVNLYYANTQINPTEYATPNRSLINVANWSLYPATQKVVNIYVDRTTVKDYDDYMDDTTYNNRYFYTINSDKIREMDTVQSETNTVLLQWNLKRSNVNIVYSRTYQKIQDILADMGGYACALFAIATCLVMGYRRYKYMMALSNEFFDFKRPIPAKKLVQRLQALNMLSIENSEAKILGPESPMSLIGINENKVIQDYFENRQAIKPLNYNEFQYFKSFLDIFCPRSVEKKLAMKGRALANKELDIIKLVRKLQEFDRIKELILDPHQKIAFDFFDKPLITQNNSKAAIYRDSVTAKMLFSKIEIESDDITAAEKTESLLQVQTKTKKKKEWKDKVPLSKFAQLYMAYRNLLEDTDPENEVLNRKLLGMLDRQLIKVFQKVDQTVGDNPDSKDFEDIIKQSLEEGENIINN